MLQIFRVFFSFVCLFKVQNDIFQLHHWAMNYFSWRERQLYFQECMIVIKYLRNRFEDQFIFNSIPIQIQYKIQYPIRSFLFLVFFSDKYHNAAYAVFDISSIIIRVVSGVFEIPKHYKYLLAILLGEWWQKMHITVEFQHFQFETLRFFEEPFGLHKQQHDFKDPIPPSSHRWASEFRLLSKQISAREKNIS